MRPVWLVLAISLVFLGTLWGVDRSRRWERPRLAAAGFEVLRGSANPARPRGLLLMPLNPACSHCLASWHRLMADCPGEPRCEERIALLVDVARPSRAALQELDARTIWWDRGGVWRARWGHRMYGEQMRFDGSGTYLGTSPPPRP